MIEITDNNFEHVKSQHGSFFYGRLWRRLVPSVQAYNQASTADGGSMWLLQPTTKP